MVSCSSKLVYYVYLLNGIFVSRVKQSDERKRFQFDNTIFKSIIILSTTANREYKLQNATKIRLLLYYTI